MTTEQTYTDKSKISSTNVDASGQMRGWFKLIETIRKTEPSPNELLTSSPSNSHINGYKSKSPETILINNSQLKSPNHISISPSHNSPTKDDDEDNDNNIQSKTKSTGSKRRSIRHKKITIRKSTRTKDKLNIIPDDDIHQRKHPSIDLSSNIPIATDIQSLPGFNQDDIRDKRFLTYSDMNTLSIHFHTCLYIDKKPLSSSSSFFTKQHIFKTRHNILTKIFKLSYLKNQKKYFQFDSTNLFNQISDIKTNHSLLSSSTSSFKTDWSVNRRNSSSYQHEPKNVFHILQLNPKKQLFSSSSINNSLLTKYSLEKQYETNYEHMKNLLIRTYYPHFHIAFQYGYYFGSKSKFLIKQENFSFNNKSELISNIDQSMTITLKSPPSIFQRQSKKRGRKSKYKKLNNKPLFERRLSEEIPPVDISFPINNNDIRKRTINERRKKQIIYEDQDLSYSDSDDDDDADDILPDELPKQNFIKNGLRSNYYKTVDSKTLSRSTRRRQQLSGSLPSFYTGIFKSNDENFSYINYKLPFDIYWFNQKEIKSPHQNKQKKLNEPKISHKNFSRNIHTNSSISINNLSSNNKKIVHKLKIEDLTENEKQIISQSTIFLKRNLQRIKEKYERKTKQQNQQIDEQSLNLFLPQNYYHYQPKITNEINLSHKDLLNLFSNHIRRSHFAKIGHCSIELIDKTCSYAQLAQLTFILNEIFNLLLNYKCYNSDIYPSNALKKCPLKRLFPMYYEVIVKPIDLTIIQNKLDNGNYFSYQSFEQDLLLLFNNAITYCGEDSDIGQAVKELERYFLDRLKIEYQSTINLFKNFTEEDFQEKNLEILKNFITRLHEKEILYGQIREILAEIIFNIDNNENNLSNINRINKNHWIVHCRCGSTYDEIPLVQCYACQLWQHVSCVIIKDSYRPYYCFECHPICENNPLSCLKMNINISQDNQSTYSTITRSDGLIIRINECYFIKKQNENNQSINYDIFSIERLWFDENHIGYASGFYYLKPSEIFPEINRKIYSNEIFRFPSTNNSININSIIRPCYVFDTGTFCKGKPISEYTSRLSSMDLFICEYRVDKLAKIFTRLPKSKHITINTKSYCFDNYIEKLSIKRDYQSHQIPRQRSIIHSNKLTTKQFEEKSSHIDGIIEKIYCHFHHANLIPIETKFSPNQFFQQTDFDQNNNNNNNNRSSKRLQEKNSFSSSIKKRRKLSISDNNQHIISLLINELIESISSHIV